MSKERILKTTINLFAHYGIKGVSMSQIAGALQISKKTLYEEFECKEQLLCSSIEYEGLRIKTLMDSIEKEGTNPVEIIVLLSGDIARYFSNYCPAFSKDILRFSEAYHLFISHRNKLIERFYIHFQKGLRECYFQPGHNYETVSALLVEQLNQTNAHHHPFIPLTFLRGICTDKGQKALKEFLPEAIPLNF